MTRPASPAPARSAPSAPSVLETLRTVWKSVLGVDDVADDANFFELGGNSIAAIRLVNRVREVLGADVGARGLLRGRDLERDGPPTGRRRTETWRHPAGAGCSRADGEVVDRARVSDQQDRMIAGHYSVPQAQIWNVPTRIRFRGALSPDALRSALTELIHRHHSLRTRFVKETAAGRTSGGRRWSPRGRCGCRSTTSPGSIPRGVAARADKVCRATGRGPHRHHPSDAAPAEAAAGRARTNGS